MYNKLFTKILDSSIWLENHSTRIVWITFLACMDQDGVVGLSSIGNVANRARVTEEEAAEAIRCLENPDTKNPDQDNEGRRIERIPGLGWFVLNASKYREIVKAENVRAATRARVREHRAKTVTNVTDVTDCNADVRKCNETVTPSDSDTEAKERESVRVREAEDTDNAVNPETSEIIESYLSEVRTIYKVNVLSREDRWVDAVIEADRLGITPAQFAATLRGLLADKSRKYPVIPQNVIDAALHARAAKCATTSKPKFLH